MHLKTGTSLKFGSYIIESVLGQGGFGITYMAVQTGLNRKVAIKEFFMKDLCNRDADTSHVSVPSVGSKELVEKFRIKFVKEAQTIAGLSHPNIIRIHDIFEENGTAYYVMEYHGSGSLADMDLPMPTDKALGYVRQIGSALDYLHSRNVMHLDVKPSNVLIDDASNAVLIDFGVSKRYDEQGHQTSSTPVGISHGYAPIEQYSQSTLTFSPATDIYALGATLYKLLTGQTPPEASVVNDEGLPEFPNCVPAPLRAVIEKAMQSRRKDRPQSVAEFLALLDAAAEEERNEEDESEEDEIVVQDDQDETDVVVSDHGQTGDQSSGSISSSVPVPVPAPRKRRPWLWLLLLALVAGVLAAVVFTGKTDDAPIVDSATIAAAQNADRLAAELATAQKAKEEDERSRFESDYNDYKTAMEMGSEYEKTESTLSQAKSKYESALKIEQSWSGNSTYSSRFNLNASTALKRVEKRLEDIAAAEAAAKKKAEEEAKKKSEEAKKVAEAKQTAGIISGHSWVDLGLPSGLKWATCNVGAFSPEDYGDYYAWGEVSTKSEYTVGNCSTYGTIGNISGNPRYDVARKKWGGSWRMPTKAEFEELIDNCTWEWTTKGGHKGYKVTGPNGNSIFLPAAGCRPGAYTHSAESLGLYWSAAPYGSDTQGAYDLYFNSGGRRSMDWAGRYDGRSGRPVSE